MIILPVYYELQQYLPIRLSHVLLV